MSPKPTRTPERISLPGGYWWEAEYENADYGSIKRLEGKKVWDVADFMHISEAKSFAAALQSPAGEWQDISTAPRDANILLADAKTVGIGKWNEEETNVKAGYNDDDQYRDWKHLASFIGGGFYTAINIDDEGKNCGEPYGKQPTHWQPLPPAPTGEGE